MLLSRKSGDPTVDRLRDKKEKRSTRSRILVDSGIGSFFKLLKVGFSPYLGFYSHLSVLLMFLLNEAARGRWIGPKTWDRIIGNFFRNFGEAVSVQSHVGAVWVDYVLIYVLICALVCIGPEMAEKSGFTK